MLPGRSFERYGPYADNLRHVLMKVERHFLTGFGDGTSPVLDAGPIEALPGAAEQADEVVAAHPELAERIDRVLQLSEGFESAYGMELLATVHWAATAENASSRRATSTPRSIIWLVSAGSTAMPSLHERVGSLRQPPRTS